MNCESGQYDSELATLIRRRGLTGDIQYAGMTINRYLSGEPTHEWTIVLVYNGRNAAFKTSCTSYNPPTLTSALEGILASHSLLSDPGCVEECTDLQLSLIQEEAQRIDSLLGEDFAEFYEAES